jgi:hypothetical protein
MDPIATLATILDESTSSEDRTEALEALGAWLKSGGFGPRVQTHPATDAWMAGDRFGTVTAVRGAVLTVLMDRSGSSRRVAWHNLVTVQS